MLSFRNTVTGIFDRGVYGDFTQKEIFLCEVFRKMDSLINNF